MEKLDEYLSQDNVNIVVRLRFFYGASLNPFKFIEFGNLILGHITSFDQEKYKDEIDELKKLIKVREARLEETK